MSRRSASRSACRGLDSIQCPSRNTDRSQGRGRSPGHLLTGHEEEMSRVSHRHALRCATPCSASPSRSHSPSCCRAPRTPRPIATGASTSSPTAPGRSPRRARTRRSRPTAASRAGASPWVTRAVDPLPPRAVTFDELCGATPAAGQKRVGSSSTTAAPPTPPTAPPRRSPRPSAPSPTAARAPTCSPRPASCAREGSRLRCRGYPATECGGEVKEVSAEAQAADTPVTIAAPAAATPTADAARRTALPLEHPVGTAGVIAGLAVLRSAGSVPRSRRRAGSPS